MARVAACTAAVASLLVVFAGPAASATTYYVDRSNPGCSDRGPGSSGKPYCSIATALTNRTGPGTTIVVRPGVYREQLTLGASGASGSEYEIRAEGPGVVIDGADDLSGAGSWTQVSGNVWLAASVTWSPKQVFLDGARLAPTTDPVAAMGAGTFQYVAGAGLYVNAGGGNPGSRELRVGRRLHGVRILGRSWIRIVGLTITGAEDKAVYLSSASDHVTIASNTITFAYRSGIQVASCADVRIESNVITDHQDDGIQLVSVQGGVVRGNFSARNARAGAEADGLHVTGASSGLVVAGNRFTANGGGGVVWETTASGNVSVQNVAWANTGHGFSVRGATGHRHVGDVAWGNAGAGFAFESGAVSGSLADVIAARNGEAAGAPQVLVDAASASGFASNDNVLWSALGGTVIRHDGADYPAIAGFAAATGNDTRSLQQDPSFVDPGGGDFHLTAGSPAIDRANSGVADWPALDAEGKSRKDDPATSNAGLGPVAYADVGAFEFEPIGSAPVAALVASPASGRAPLGVTLDAGGSSDPDGNIASYRFEFGDGGVAGPQSSAIATHTYAAGSWLARVTVTDATGSTSTATASISVSADLAPIAALSVAADSGAALPGFIDLVTDSSAVFGAVPATRPAYLEPVTEPTFGTKVTRIAGDYGSALTTSTGTGTWGLDARHHYSKDQPWNADGTLIALQNNGTPKRVFLDGDTYEVKYGKCSNYFVGDDRWHPSLPNVRINVVGNELQWFDVVNCVKLRSWTLPFSPRYIGDGEGNPSWDGRYLALCDSSRMFVVDMDPQAPYAPYPSVRIGPVVSFANCGMSECRLGWVSVSPSGKYVVCKYGGDHPRVYDLDPATLAMTPRPMPESSPRCSGTAAQGYVYDVGHCDMTLNPFDGNEDVLIGQEHCGNRGGTVQGQAMGGVIMVRLRDGAITSLTSPDNEAYPHHISTQNVARPGWAYVGYYPDPGKRYSDEIIAVKLDGSQQVERLAHKHSDTSGDCYRCEAHAVPSPDGRRVIWASNWRIDCIDCWPQSDLKAYLVDLRPFATDTTGVAPLTVVADASSSSDPDGAIVSYRFDFGDGTIVGPQASPRATHTYQAGTWTASVTVTDDAGNTRVATATIVVHGNRPPESFIDAPAADDTIQAGESVTFAGSGQDPDGDALTFAWDFAGAAPSTSAEDPGAIVFATAGAYLVTLTATDDHGVADPTPATRTITVLPPPDRAPVVTAPASVTGSPGLPITFGVSAADPDGDGIASLGADLSGLPAGHQASFTAAAGNASGTFTWTPPAAQEAGVFPVSFTASNALSGAATTEITIVIGNRAPQAALTVTPSSGFAPLAVTADASGSSDPDGTIATYRFDFGDGTVIGPQASPVATHTYAAGVYSVAVTVNDGQGGSAIAVQPVAAWRNLCGNPSFESATTGWNAYSSSTIARVTGGIDGTYALEMRGPSTTSTFGVNDSPNWVSPVQGAGVRYRFSAAVRSPSSTGLARIQVREYLSGTQQGVTTKSPGVTLSPSWQTITVDYVTTVAGSTIDFQITDVPVAPGEVFLTDQVSIRIVDPDTAPIVTAPATVSVAEGATVQVPVAVTDPDGQAIASLAASLAGLPAGANASFVAGPGNGSGTLTWTPGFDHAGGPYTVSFTATNTLAATASTQITVTDADRAPVVSSPPAAAIAEGAPLAVEVTASDPDGQPIGSLTADLSELPAGHGATFTAEPGNARGTLSWTPSFEAAGGPYRVRFVAANTASDTAEIEITVGDVDRAPVIDLPAVASGVEGERISVVVSAFDPDGDPIEHLIADLSGLPGRNDAVFVPDAGKASGTLTWTPGFADSGDHAVTLLAENALSTIASLTLRIANVDRPPVVQVADTVLANENEPVAVVVTASDPDGDPIGALTADLAGLPAGASASFTPAPGNASGELVWTPGFDDAGGPWVVTFHATNAAAASGAVAIQVANQDRPPVLVAPTVVSAVEDSQLVVEIEAVDPDGDPIETLGAELVELPAGHDAVFTRNEGTGAGRLTWTPTRSDAPGPYFVTFVASNALSAFATTEVLVADLDRAPQITAPASVSVADSGLVRIEVAASDPDGEPIGALTADLSALPAGHDASFVASADQSSGVLTWTPRLGGSGSFPIAFTAGNALSASAVTTVQVTGIPHPPQVAAPESALAREGESLVLEVAASDPDGEPIASLRADLSGLPAGANAAFAVSADHATGTLTWTPGFADSGAYVVSFVAANGDSAVAATRVRVENVDRAPVVAVAATASVTEGDTLRLAIAASDPDGDPIASLAADLGALPAGHGATLTVAEDHASAVLEWVPDFGDAGGPYAIPFTAGNALSGAAACSVTVANRDRAPVVVAPASASGAEGAPLRVEITASDPDGEPIDSLVADLSSLPAGDPVTFTPAADRLSGVLEWTPNHEAARAEPWLVRFTAANGLAGEATVAIEVTNTDRAPLVAAPAVAVTAQGDSLRVEVTASDPDGDPIASLTADLSALPAGHGAAFAEDADHGGGVLRWTPGPSAVGGPYSVTFRAANALEGAASTAVTVTWVDHAPVVAAPEVETVAEGAALAFEITASDPDGEPIAALTADLGGLPAGHGATFTPSADRSAGTLAWTPPFDAARAEPYVIVFTAANGLEGADTTRVFVADVDRAPVVEAPAAVAGAEGTPLEWTVTAQDPDGDPIASLAADLSGLPAGAAASFETNAERTAGTLRWTPGYADAGGPYAIVFTAANARSGEDTTSVTIAAVDRAPVAAVTGPTTIAEGDTLRWTVTASDPDGEPIEALTADLSSLPGAPASFVVAADHTSAVLTWATGFGDAGGPYAVAFVAANALADTARATIQVANVDRAPVVVAPATVDGVENQLVTFQVSANDPDGDPIDRLEADLTGLPAGHGATFTPAADHRSGTFAWTPGATHSGVFTVGFRAVNAAEGSASTQVTVADLDRAPVVAAPEIASGAEGQSLEILVTAGDPDGDAISSLTADLSGLAAATFTPSADRRSGTLRWTPGWQDAGVHLVTFTATNALSGSATTSIEIAGVDRAPAASVAASASVVAGATLSLTVSASDPDGEPIQSWSWDPNALPIGHGATLSPAGDWSTATFTWTPQLAHLGGPYRVAFTAANEMAASCTTWITVTSPDRPPVAALAVSTPVTSAPVVVTASAAGSVDPEGAIVSYRFDFGNGVVVGPQASPIASASYASAGVYTVSVIVADAGGASDTATAIVQAHLGNLCTNPGFENTTTGWTSYGSASLSRVSGAGRNGGYAYQASKSSGSGWGWNDSPDWVPVTAGVGRTYRYLAWVRSVAHSGQAFLRVQEFLGSTQKGATMNSTPVTVGPEWKLLTLDYTVTTAGTRLDLKVLYNAIGSSEKVLLDDVQVLLLPAGDQPPVVMAPASVVAIAGQRLSIEVRAADPDGQALGALGASFASLPPGHDATFVSDPARGVATLSWTPASADIGPLPYVVTLDASSGGLAASVPLEIVVSNAAIPNLCANPGLESSASGWTSYGSASISRVNSGRTGSYGIQLAASSGTGWGVNDSPDIVPTVAGVGRTYRYSAWVRSATSAGKVKLRVQEFLSSTQKGVTTESPEVTLTTTWRRIAVSYTVTTASTRLDMKIVNAPVAASESFLVDDVEVLLLPLGDRPPVVVAPGSVTVARDQPMSISVNASDPDGDAILDLAADLSALPPGNDATFTPAPDQRSGVLRWTPSAAAAGATPWVVTFTATNAKRASTSTAITVVDEIASNLCGNPGFESSLTGWGTYGSVTLARVTGGHEGEYALRMTGSSTSSFGCDDVPNWVATVARAGDRYRYSAWVRSDASTSPVKLRLYEILNGSQIGSTVYSQEIPVSTSWQQLSLEYTTLAAGSTLSLRVTMAPAASSQSFLVDDVSIQLVAASPALTAASLEDAAPAGGGEGAAGAAPPRAWIDPLAESDSRATVRIEGLDALLEGGLPAIALRASGRELPVSEDRLVLGLDADANGREELALDLDAAALRDLAEGEGEAPGVVITIARDGESLAVPLALELPREDLVFGAGFAPNPARGAGVLSFALTRSGPVRIDLFDLAGRRLRTLVDAPAMRAGRHRLAVGGLERLGAGVYYYRLEAAEGVRTGRVVTLK